MPKPFSEQERQIIQQNLLDKGYDLFSTHGLTKVSVAELAQAAAISKGAFYQFYDSKEALFMDIVEEAEKRYRLELFQLIEQPGPSMHARLYAVLERAMSLWHEIPILQFFASDDYNLLVRRMPPDRLQEHMGSDQVFLEQFIDSCRSAGIAIKISADAFRNLLYALLLLVVHHNDFGEGMLNGTFDIMLKLVTAYCLGEVPSVPIVID
jgi:AcrR family transcriptional regulator